MIGMAAPISFLKSPRTVSMLLDFSRLYFQVDSRIIRNVEVKSELIGSKNFEFFHEI